MAYVVVSLVALVVAALTLFSGFGLGTLLMPVFAIFFPVEVAVGSTAVVHLANNLFKVGLVGRKANWRVVARFAIPAAIAAMIGALILNYFSHLPPIGAYTLGAQIHRITVIKLIIAVLMVVFALLDLLPRFENLAFDTKYLSLGGALSGFFGGLSGNQGALRSAFLIRAGLDKEAFVGTGVVSAVVVDVSRLLVYGLSFFAKDFAVMSKGNGTTLVLVATLAAFLGSFVGSRLVKKVTMRTVQVIVAVMLLLLAGALGTGLV